MGKMTIQRILIAKSLIDQEEWNFISLLDETQIYFAWCYVDMQELDPELIVHKLVVRPNAKPVKHKLHKMHPHIALLVKEELQKMLDVGFIGPIAYLEWISNIVPVGKPTGGIRIYIDSRDLNKACPKDDFPFPNIDMIVGLKTRHKMLSLMDGFCGYNQVNIVEEDQHKTMFTTPWGKFCYHVMPFGLKKTGITYQREMTTIFHDLLHDIIEDYVDDLLGKPKTHEEHISILRKIFERQEKYKLCLNPKKYVWGHIWKAVGIHSILQRN